MIIRRMLAGMMLALLSVLVLVTPGEAQWQVPLDMIPIGKGAGTGFGISGPGTVYARAKGAICDGTTDDRVAIQAAIDAAPDGGTVIIPTSALGCLVTENGSNGYALLITRPLIIRGAGAGTSACIRPSGSIGTAVDTIRWNASASYNYTGSGTVNLCLGNPVNGTRAGRHGLYLDTTVAGGNFPRFTVDGAFILQSSNAGVAVYHNNNTTNNVNGGLYTSSFSGTFNGGISLNGSGDSIWILKAIFAGTGAGVYANLTIGAGNLMITGNCTAPAGCVIIDRSASTFISGEFEQLATNTQANNSLIDLRGATATLGPVTIWASQLQDDAGTGNPTLIRVGAALGVVIDGGNRIATSTARSPINITASATGTVIGSSNTFVGTSPNFTDNGTNTIYGPLSKGAATSLIGNSTGSKAQATDIALGGAFTIIAGPTLVNSAVGGDISIPLNSVTSTLATVNSNVGTFGSATQASQVTVNAKGLVTAAVNVTVTPAVGSITGLGTGVATALAVNIGTAGSFVVNGGALGSPSSAGTLPAHTLGGTVSGGGNQINNVIIGTSTPLAGSFTTVAASSSVTVTASNTIASATGAALDDVNVAATTTTITGNTGSPITRLSKVGIYRPTLTDASAVTVTDAAALYIDNAPLAAGSVTITNPWALLTGAGQVKHASANETATVTDSASGAINAALVVQRNVTSLSATPVGMLVDLTVNNSTAAQSATGIRTVLTIPSANSTNHNLLTGITYAVAQLGSGNVTTLRGFSSTAAHNNTGTVSNLQAGSFAVTNNSGGTVTATISFAVNQPIGATAALTSVWTNITGINIADQNPTGAGTNTLTNPPVALKIASQTATGALAIQQVGSGLNSFAAVSTFSSGTASTSPATGAVVVASTGGLGAGGAIWAGTYLATTVTTVNALPACGAGIKGARTFVSDNNTALAFAAVITTGGAIQTPVYCDGTVWRQGANDNIPASLMRKFA